MDGNYSFEELLPGFADYGVLIAAMRVWLGLAPDVECEEVILLETFRGLCMMYKVWVIGHYLKVSGREADYDKWFTEKYGGYDDDKYHAVYEHGKSLNSLYGYAWDSERPIKYGF